MKPALEMMTKTDPTTLPPSCSGHDADKDLAWQMTVRVLSAPSRCLFTRERPVGSSEHIARIQRELDARCARGGLSDEDRKKAHGFVISLLDEAIASLFKHMD